PATRRDHTDRVEAAQQLLATRFRERLGLDEVAQHVHSSPFHLCRLFRRATGRSIGSYRMQLRLRESIVRVAEGRPDLTALAFDLGSTDHSHLSNAFRREFGISPSDFRRSATGFRLREMSRNLQV